MWIQISQLLKKLADQDPTVYHTAYVMFHGHYGAKNSK